MTPRTQTQPLDDPRMWRRLVALAHPDAGGGHELFVWTAAVKDAVCGGGLQLQAKPSPRWREASTRRPTPGPSAGPSAGDAKPRIPYPTGTDFGESTRRALRVEGQYASVLSLLGNCRSGGPGGYLAHEERRGACYRRLAAIGHLAGMSRRARSGWYRCAEAIPLSDRHASHILGQLNKRQAA